MKYISARVTKKDRAGRAPYNFVPLPDGRWHPVTKPPDDNVYGENLRSGVIDLEIEALTDFYTRGMWGYREFTAGKGEPGEQPEPFSVDGKLRLPGSSMRGLIRTMVEIMTASPMDQVNDTQLFFRTVASVPDTSNLRSFEPQARAYKDRIVPGGILTVKAGYMYNNRDRWSIRPAGEDTYGRQYYRYRTSELWARRAVRFDADGDFANVGPGGSETGWLVCSGGIYGKVKQWVIRAEEPAAADIAVPDEVREAYLKGGVTRDIRQNGFEYSDQTQGIPCFYLEANGAVECFGHTPYFRMPYKARPTSRIPLGSTRRGRESQWDMVHAMFGFVSQNEPKDGLTSRRGRVFVEDGILQSAPDPAVSERVRSAVLGQPKPTTYQHYLVQPSDDLAKVVHWDGDAACDGPVWIRGHKLYWHRPGAAIPEPDPAKTENVASRFREAKSGAKFTCRIRFDNLRDQELGALLAAIDLPEGCAHHLGMGKPLGLGSFRVSIRAAQFIDRRGRYRSLFSGDGKLETGLAQVQMPVLKLEDIFARWYPDQSQTMAELWKTERFRELHALLKFTPPNAEWLDVTRYLEFGKMPPDYNDGRNYNEYNEVGYPELPRPKLSKRRPLPPATQVREAGPNVPRDKRPPFQKPGGSGDGAGRARPRNWR